MFGKRNLEFYSYKQRGLINDCIAKLMGEENTLEFRKAASSTFKSIKEKRKNRSRLKSDIKRIKTIEDQKSLYLQGNLDLSGGHPLYAKLRGFLSFKPGEWENIRNKFFIKFGRVPRCAYTGIAINLNSSGSYSLDHIVPRSRGGEDTFDNMQVTTLIVNQMKTFLTNEEFISLCKLISDRNYESSKFTNGLSIPNTRGAKKGNKFIIY